MRTLGGQFLHVPSLIGRRSYLRDFCRALKRQPSRILERLMSSYGMTPEGFCKGSIGFVLLNRELYPVWPLFAPLFAPAHELVGMTIRNVKCLAQERKLITSSIR